VVDRWAVVIRSTDGSLRIEEVRDFLTRTRLAEDTPSRPLDNLSVAQATIPDTVYRFQSELVALRHSKEAEIQQDLDSVLNRLSALETRFKAQLTLALGDLPENETGLSAADKRRATIRRNREQKIERLFHDWAEWFERTRRMVDDPNPHVDVKAVFVG
jgi:chromosome segregation ATPase